MTREEADWIAARAIRVGGVPSSQFVQILVDLGVLKLEGPEAGRNPISVFHSVCWDERLPANQILKALDAAGLKIVDK